jgi:serine/threonine protein kinase
MATQPVRARTSQTNIPDTSGSSELRNYRLDALIGQDDLATIYEATHTMLDRPVDVHILRRTDWVSASRFQQAARLAGRLSHPNLLPVIDAGHDDQFGDYMITARFNARSLTELLQEEPIEPMLALRVMTQIAAALDYLHEQHVIHRDIQPANILVTPEGIAYLTGLGLAASPETPPDLSKVDEADYLTPYSAPEQRLDQGEASPALDVYGLGAVLWHLLSGEVPPAPEEPIPALARHNSALRNADPVVQRMLARAPAERPPSAGAAMSELRQRLRDIIDHATDDMEESRWEPVAEWLENPLETVLGKVLQQHVADKQPAPVAAEEAAPDIAEAVPTESTVAESEGALRGFETFLSRTRTRADTLHRADVIRRLLNRWSSQGFFRRPALGHIIKLEQIVSYNIYFYDLATLYETRTPPEQRHRPATPEDSRSFFPAGDVWDAPVTEPEQPFAPVRPQQCMLPNSTHVYACPTCGGEGRVVCQECQGRGEVEKRQRVRGHDNTVSDETIKVTCPACRSYGKQDCRECQGAGNMAEEQFFSWSRSAQLWQNTDDLEGLPRRAVENHTTAICRTEIDPYAGHWHSVAPLGALLHEAITGVKNDHTRIIRAELQIRGVPITEIDFQLNEKEHRLYLVGHASEVVSDWSLLNPERIALVSIGVVLALVLLIAGLVLLFG